MVRVRELKIKMGVNNVISEDCQQCIFTDCGMVQPQSLNIEAAVGNCEITFCDTSSEIHVRRITIGPRG